MRCVVCRGVKRRTRGFLCGACQKSYDRSGYGDGTILSAMTWAANRARLAAKRGHEGDRHLEGQDWH